MYSNRKGRENGTPLQFVAIFSQNKGGGKQGPCKLLNNTSYRNPGTNASEEKIRPTSWQAFVDCPYTLDNKVPNILQAKLKNEWTSVVSFREKKKKREKPVVTYLQNYILLLLAHFMTLSKQHVKWLALKVRSVLSETDGLTSGEDLLRWLLDVYQQFRI